MKKTLVGGLALAFLFFSDVLADGPQEQPEEEVVIIPLNHIWAYQMPGTRPMSASKRNGKYTSPEGPLIDEIRQALQILPARKEEAASGFAVPGSGMEALRQAHAVLTGKQQPLQSIPEGTEISIVFFSHSFNRYVHLHDVKLCGPVVKLCGPVVNVRFRFVPHMTENRSEHFAIIPLGKFPVGRLQVDIEQVASEQGLHEPAFEDVDSKWEKRGVCRPFSVSIVDRESN
jgi:hypothetical protein